MAATPERWQDLKRKLGAARSWGVSAELVDASEARRRLPFLDESRIHGAYWVEDDGIAKPVRVRLELVNAELVSGDAVVSLGVLPGTGAGRIESRAVTWTVRVGDNTRAASATIVVESEKAGTVRRTLELSSF